MKKEVAVCSQVAVKLVTDAFMEFFVSFLLQVQVFPMRKTTAAMSCVPGSLRYFPFSAGQASGVSGCAVKMGDVLS
jgi:hypothetical protein